MSRKEFVESVKFNTQNVSNKESKQTNYLNKFIEKLSEKYPDFSITLEEIEKRHSNEKDDFISIKVKTEHKPINFRIPAERVDLSIYQTSPEYDTLNYRYDMYNTIYKDKIINEFIEERKFLQERFPNVVFNTKIRQKSKFSYEDKIIERMHENKYLGDSSKKTYFIKDVIAGRHIISSIDGSSDPEVLDKLCFEFEKALMDFRTTSEGNNFDIVLKKDYITNPKENGYKSLHLISEDVNDPNCSFETQIRTFDMEEQSKHDEKIAHDTYKPRIIDHFAPLRVPIYTSVTPFNDNNGHPSIYTLPPEDAFYHFYAIPFTKYAKELNMVMPVINEIRNELHYKNYNNKEQEIE